VVWIVPASFSVGLSLPKHTSGLNLPHWHGHLTIPYPQGDGRTDSGKQFNYEVLDKWMKNAQA
jgi:hypothetical protein